MDKEQLQRGEVIPDQLIEAIEDSRLAIVVLSPTYAASSWCLDELVKILECKSKWGQVVLPVFFNVQTCDVRHQVGGYWAGFQKFEERLVDPREVQKQREALTEVANGIQHPCNHSLIFAFLIIYIFF
ncbi:hypothetical protein MLD38_032427 [Melastoma candidum]|uniref:Uncharacterized protein n=1 Tax=Melastoma candidum TaxID=119954 RepID=A0ACB9M411_9MYRT|nr:hypothetical protein MLD38_032427 [Melastoma candidum]